MRMRLKGSSWILLAITLLVGLYAYFFEYKKKQADQVTKDQEALVIKLDKSDMTKIEIIHKDHVVLEKQAGAWKITSPVTDDADATQVNSFLDTVTQESIEMEISEDVMKPKVYGLDKPQAKMIFTGSKGTPIQVDIGEEAIQGKHYLRVNASNNVIVSSVQWKYLAEKKLADFRRKEILRGGDLQKISIEVSGKPKVLLVKGEKSWNVEGVKYAVDTPILHAYVTQAQNLRALSVESENQNTLAKFGLDKPALVLRVQSVDNKDPVVLRFGSPQNKGKDLYLVSSALKAVYKFQGAILSNFIKSASDFRDREEPFKFSLAEVIGVRTKGPKFDFRFIKKGEAWYLEKPDPNRDVDQTQLMMLLTSLQGARVHQYLGELPFKAERSIQLLDKDGNSLLLIQVAGAQKGTGRILIKSSHIPDVMSMDPAVVEAWPGLSLVKEKAVKEKVVQEKLQEK